jgi:cysteine-rich repeat protein/YVTN family beta-propeller protein
VIALRSSPRALSHIFLLAGTAAILLILWISFGSPLCSAATGNCDITVGDGPIAEVVSGTGLYIANNNAGTVSVIDTSTNSIEATIAVGSFPYALASFGTGVYVSNNTDDTVSLIDTTALSVEKTIAVGSGPHAIGVSGTGVYVANENTNTISVIDTDTNTVTTTVTVGLGPTAFGMSATGVYVANSGGNSVSVIDRTTNTVDKTISVGTTPTDIGTSGTGVIVVNNGSNNVSIIDRRFNTVSATVSVGTNPVYLAVSGTHAYVGNAGANTISIINIPTRAVLDTLTTENYPERFGVSGTGVYVTHHNHSTIAIIDTDTDTIIRNVQVDSVPIAIAFSATNAYVANYGSDSVSVVSTQTNLALTQCTAVCGNNEVGDSEECDDGNTTGGDGCSSTCTVESSWSCTGDPSVCTQACAAGVAPGATAARHYGSACFAFYDLTTDLNFADAENACESVGGFLVTVGSAARQTLISSLGSYAWIGLTDQDVEGTFRWVSNTPFVYSNWASGQPNGGGSENCVIIENANLWHDYSCGGQHPYFCEIPDATSSSSSSVTSARPDVKTGGLRDETLQHQIDAAVKRYRGSASSQTSQPLIHTAAPPSKSSLQSRTCARVMRRFADNSPVLRRVDARLKKVFGFTCGS